MHQIYLGLGSNIGNREQWLETTIDHLNNDNNISIENISPFIETEAVSSYTQPHFINAALKARTIYTPYELLDICESIEKECNRTTKGLWAPRTIDIDVLFYDNQIINEERLQIPHPLIQDRLFVLDPLLKLAPDFIHPTLEKSIKTLHQECQHVAHT